MPKANTIPPMKLVVDHCVRGGSGFIVVVGTGVGVVGFSVLDVDVVGATVVVVDVVVVFSVVVVVVVGSSVVVVVSLLSLIVVSGTGVVVGSSSGFSVVGNSVGDTRGSDDVTIVFSVAISCGKAIPALKMHITKIKPTKNFIF